MSRSGNCLINGYILIETLVSIAILSLGLMMVINAFSANVGALRTSRNYAYASVLAEEKLSEIEREGMLDVNKWRGKSGSFFDLNDVTKTEPRRKNFGYEIDIELLKDEEGNLLDTALLKTVVKWNELRVTRQLELADYMRRKTP